jgi:ABC-type antimicrobial peptide transport system permease subunit
MKNIPTSNRFLIGHSFKESKRRFCYFILCLTSCFLITLVSLISKSILEQAPVIFLMIAEQNVGETDIVIRPIPRLFSKPNPENVYEFQYFDAHLNVTQFIERMQSRTGIEKEVANQTTGRTTLAVSTHQILGDSGYAANLILIDSNKEKYIELGRSYPYSKLNSDECIIHSQLASIIGITQGQQMWIRLDWKYMLRNILIHHYSNDGFPPYDENLKHIGEDGAFLYLFTCKVKQVIDDNYGKFAQDSKYYVLMESETFFKHINKFPNTKLNGFFPDLPQVFESLNMKDFSNSMIINFNRPRISHYLVTNFDDLQYKAVTYANKVYEVLGSDFVTISLPLVSQLKKYFFGSIFMGIILNIILIILFFLSLILIYSLLLITTETNSFELGIIRMLGTTKYGIIKLIIIQCLMFSIPAFLAAFGLHYPILVGISALLGKLTDSNLELKSDWYSIVLSMALCFLAPLVASIIPIRNILSQNLSWALNTTMSKTSGIKVEITSAVKTQRRMLLIFGSLTFLYGCSVYYFLPLSLLSMNFGLLLTVFLWILIGMLLGFILLSLNVEYLVQLLFTNIFFFWTRSYTKVIILTNLSSHRLRNRKTTMMFALALGFFIMVSTGLDIVLKYLTLQQINNMGSYYEISIAGNQQYLAPHTILPTLDVLKDQKLIDGFTFISPNLKSVCGMSSKTRIQNLGKSMSSSVDCYAIMPNYYDIALDEFLNISEEDDDDIPLGQKLYSKKNDGRAGMSGIFTWEYGLHLDDQFFLQVQREDSMMPFLMKSAYLLRSSPGMMMNEEPSVQKTRAVTLPVHTYLDILNKCQNYLEMNKTLANSFSLSEFPINRVLLKVSNNNPFATNAKKISDIIFKSKGGQLRTTQYDTKEKKFNQINQIGLVIFGAVSLIVIIYCFFNLGATMTINIYEQKKELAILRSLGMTSRHILYVYIAEAFILIFCASFMGMIIGTIISWTMAFQVVIFVSLPITFTFPLYPMILIIVSSVSGAFITTYYPSKGMLKLSISHLIRNG